MKIEIPIPTISDFLFDSEITKTEIDKSPESEEIEKINQEARQEYKDQHPTIKEFVEELND